jgi:hypothetical protein
VCQAQERRRTQDAGWDAHKEHCGGGDTPQWAREWQSPMCWHSVDRGSVRRRTQRRVWGAGNGARAGASGGGAARVAPRVGAEWLGAVAPSTLLHAGYCCARTCRAKVPIAIVQLYSCPRHVTEALQAQSHHVLCICASHGCGWGPQPRCGVPARSASVRAALFQARNEYSSRVSPAIHAYEICAILHHHATMPSIDYACSCLICAGGSHTRLRYVSSISGWGDCRSGDLAIC